MEELCTTLGQSVAGEVVLYGLGALAASGTLAQVDAWIPERAKRRWGRLKKVFDAIAGNYRESRNVQTSA